MMTDYSDVIYDSHCGRLTLYARDYNPGGARPVALCMHGLTRNSADFEWLAAHLARRYRVISVDQRGRGLSDHDPEHANYQPAVYVQDMFHLLDKLGIDKAVLIGTSMGGLMSMVMGATVPDRVVGIVINDIGPVLSPEGLDRIRSYVGRTRPAENWEDAARQAELTNKVAFPDFGPDDWMAFARRTYREDASGKPVLAYDPAIAKGLEGDSASTVPPDLWALWDKLAPIPILAIRGGLSDILSADTMAEMARRHPGMQAVTVPNCGHAPILDEAEAVTAIDHFMQEMETRV